MNQPGSRSQQQLRVAIIGAGPAGFYAADALLKELSSSVQIDMFDKIPAPYGLVRYGVAPDHEKIKSVTKIYQRILSAQNVRFFGNVTFGSDVNHDELKAHYHQILYTVGTPTARELRIPGESLVGCISATDFVAWYNGHPDYRNFDVDLSGEHAVVVGAGNVALDVARILARSVDELKTTDIADHALEQLDTSQIRKITILARRGPAQAKFTPAELKELAHLQSADILIGPDELVLDQQSTRQAMENSAVQRLLFQLNELSQLPFNNRTKSLCLRFLVSPVEIQGSDHIETVCIERNRLMRTENGYLNAVGTGKFETLPADLLIRSIGYRGVALPGVPFDESRGTIPNRAGRIIDPKSGEIVPGEYVAGWVKRGPTGVIGTNKADSAETVAQMLADREMSMQMNIASDIEDLIRSRVVHYNNREKWQHVEAREIQLGREQGRPRVKLTTREELLGLQSDD